MIERVQNLGQDEIHGEKGPNNNDHSKEEIGNETSFACLCKVVHQVDPTFECANLKHGVQCLAKVVKAWYAVENSLVAPYIVINDWV